MSHHAARSLLVRATIKLKVTPTELHDLIETLNAKAVRAADFPEQADFADFLFRRIAELREAAR